MLVFHKSLTTNLVAFFTLVVGYFLPSKALYTIGIFAFSGSITNWLAIYMLFERVPFLYGSGVIPNRFDEFKLGIKSLILDEFFNIENIKRFIGDKMGTSDFAKLESKIDFTEVYEKLIAAIMESPLGSMLAMFGGKEALEPIREPMIAKLKEILAGIIADLKKEGGDSNISNKLMIEVEQIIDNRLAELTPKMVKDIIEKMIKKHLGWLVVWGGVFGGLIGFVFYIL